MKKEDLKKFYAKSDDVCRRPDGSTNGYLTEPRAIEEFLKRIEPNYNAVLDAIRRREIDEETIYVIAGFVAYVMSCSPTAMRIGTPHIAATLQSGAEMLDAQGLLPPAPEGPSGRSLSDLLDDGTVRFNVDEKYPQAIGIPGIEARVAIFGNALWDLMFADPAYGGFFTSDFPVALGPSYDNRVMSKTVPLAPDVAVRIHPLLRERGKEPDFSFRVFASVSAHCRRKRCERSTPTWCARQNRWDSAISMRIGFFPLFASIVRFGWSPSSHEYPLRSEAR